jgi:hypothetical protein
MCANLIQNGQLDDRFVILFGAGQALLLRHCIAETPGFKLIKANNFPPE